MHACFKRKKACRLTGFQKFKPGSSLEFETIIQGDSERIFMGYFPLLDCLEFGTQFLFSMELLGQNLGLHLSAATAEYFIFAQAVESGVNTG